MIRDTALHDAPRDAPDAARPAERILVVVPTLDEERHIAACLDSLAHGLDGGLDGHTVVVADGGSRDRTRAVVESMRARVPNLRLLDNPGRLQSAGINAAVAAHGAGHGVLVRCDAHAVYPPAYVAGVARALRERGAASLVVPMDATGQTGFARAAAWAMGTPLGTGGSAHRGGRRSGWVDHGHHAGMDLDWFRRVGGYDASFSHNEDAELDHRLRAAGGGIWMDAGLRLDYVMRPTFGGLARQYWNYGRGRARMLAKHRARPRLRQVAPAVNLAGMAGALLLSPAWPAALMWPLLYLAALAGASAAGAVALRSPSGLWAGPALGAMHNAWGAGLIRQLLGGAAR